MKEMPSAGDLPGGLLSLVLILLAMTGPASSEGRQEQCGPPAIPTNGTISTSNKFYFAGEKVSYKCHAGFVLFGQDERTCQTNGTWTGDPPLCDFNLARGKHSLQSKTLFSYSPELAVDGNPDTCSFTPKSPEPRWWQVHLGHKFNVLNVGVTISPGSKQEFTIYVIELLVDNKALYKPCVAFKGVFETHKGLFLCNDGLGHPGQFVYIRDDRKEEEYFGLCEVEVFAYREQIPCGGPDVPLHASVTQKGSQANFTCETGYRLEGNASLNCTAKGKWRSPPPSCKEVQCSVPPAVGNGFIEMTHYRETYSYGTVATYHCNPGHVLTSNGTLECTENGTWSNSEPSCKAVSCGNPPEFPNSRYALLNGSTFLNGIAVYTCQNDFKMHEDIEETVTTCLDNGTWASINISCQNVDYSELSAAKRKGEARSLEFPQKNMMETTEDASPFVLVIILAILASLLTIAMVFIGAVLMKKHCLHDEHPINNLLYCDNKQWRSCRDTSNEDCLAGMHVEKLNPSLTYTSYVQRTTVLDDESLCAGLSTLEPPYDEVKARSEHSYETIRKKSIDPSDAEHAHILNGINNTTDSTKSGSQAEDKDSLGYESLINGKENSYETVKCRGESGYETLQLPLELDSVGLKEHHYETVKENGYETIKGKSISLIPTSDAEENLSKTNFSEVPDILQDLSSNGTQISPEIQALYAKVDKSKKKHTKRFPSEKPQYSSLTSASSDPESSPQTDLSLLSDEGSVESSPPGPQDFIRKMNKFSSESVPQNTEKPTMIEHSTGTLRPLPPLPLGK